MQDEIRVLVRDCTTVFEGGTTREREQRGDVLVVYKPDDSENPPVDRRSRRGVCST